MDCAEVRLERVEKKMESILDNLDLLLPVEYPIAALAVICEKDKSTIRKHLSENYIEGRDYRQTKENGKIYVARSAALEIRRKYVK